MNESNVCNVYEVWLKYLHSFYNKNKTGFHITIVISTVFSYWSQFKLSLQNTRCANITPVNWITNLPFLYPLEESQKSYTLSCQCVLVRYASVVG